MTIAIEIGIIGWGANGGAIPELRIGLIRLAICRGSMLAKVRGMLSDAADAMKGAAACQ